MVEYVEQTSRFTFLDAHYVSKLVKRLIGPLSCLEPHEKCRSPNPHPLSCVVSNVIRIQRGSQFYLQKV